MNIQEGDRIFSFFKYRGMTNIRFNGTIESIRSGPKGIKVRFEDGDVINYDLHNVIQKIRKDRITQQTSIWINYKDMKQDEVNKLAEIKRNVTLDKFRKKTNKLIFAQRFINSTQEKLSSRIRDGDFCNRYDTEI